MGTRCTLMVMACALGACALGHGPEQAAPDAGTADAGKPARWPDTGPVEPPPDGGDDPYVGGPPAACGEPTGSFNGIRVIECIPEGMEGVTPEPVPLVLVLHGYTQDPRDLLASTQWDVLAGRYGFYVAFPQASADNRAWAWFHLGRSRGQNDPAGLVAFVDDFAARHNVDRDRVFVAGISAGGYMAVNLLADYPEVFAAGSATSGGAHGCDVLCPSLPSGGANAAAVIAEHPEWWNDPATRKPRLLLLHGDLDQTNAPGNSEQLVQQWTAALGIDATPDNAALGLPAELAGYPYAVYAADGEPAVAHIRMTDLGHGTPVCPGDAPEHGGYDPMPSKTADPCGWCPQDWTNTGSIWGPYHEAEFFGLVR